MKKKVACVFGGCSSEYPVSLMSATSVIKAIDQEKYDLILIGITQDGDFYLYSGDVDKIENNEWQKAHTQKITFSTNRSDHGIVIIKTGEIIRLDLVLPILHGKNGEDGRLQGLLELAGIPYAGCDMASSAICMDKNLAHILAATAGVAVPAAHLFSKLDTKEEIKSQITDLKYPIYVKPLKAGSSYGITKVKSADELDAAIDFAFSYDKQIIIEENIDGFEVCCAIMGNEALTIGEVNEIEISSGFFDFKEKYTPKLSKIHLPARLPDEERERIKQVAAKTYRALGCSGFARVDLFYTPDKHIVFNEVNTIPGCTSHSLYPSMMKAIGLSLTDVVEQWIKLGLTSNRD